VVGRKEETMYTGTLIDELMAAVERNERRSLQAHSQEETPISFYAAQPELVGFESELVGAA